MPEAPRAGDGRRSGLGWWRQRRYDPVAAAPAAPAAPEVSACDENTGMDGESCVEAAKGRDEGDS